MYYRIKTNNQSLCKPDKIIPAQKFPRPLTGCADTNKNKQIQYVLSVYKRKTRCTQVPRELPHLQFAQKIYCLENDRTMEISPLLSQTKGRARTERLVEQPRTNLLR
jgi:hypothetical protein